jgi:hypothetical protein
MPATRDTFGTLSLVVGLVVVVTLVTLPYVGPFFAAALGGGTVVAALLSRRHLRRRS